MQLLKFILDNPDAIAALLSLVGAGAWRQRNVKRAEKIDRWAAAAAAVIGQVVASGALKSHGELVAKALREFRTLAAAAGIRPNEAEEARVKAILVEHLNEIAAASDKASRAQLGGAANELLHDLRRWEAARGKPLPPPAHGLGVDVTIRK